MSENIFSVIGYWILAGLAAERLAEVIVHGEIFFDLRNKVVGYSLDHESPKLAKLVTCGWCCSFWTCMFLSLTLPGGWFHLVAGHNLIVKWLALVGVANTWHAVFRLILRGRILTIDLNVNDQTGEQDLVDE